MIRFILLNSKHPMYNLSKNDYTSAQSKSLGLCNSIAADHLGDFMSWIEEGITQREQQQPKTVITWLTEYMEYVKQVKLGHVQLWAKIYAQNFEAYESALALADASLRQYTPEDADRELTLHYRALERNQPYIDYVLHQFRNENGFEQPERKAFNYFKRYTQQLSLGKSEQFAHHYSEYLITLDQPCPESLSHARIHAAKQEILATALVDSN